MIVVLKFFQWVWRKITCWVLFRKHKGKSTVSEHPDSEKSSLKVEKAHSVDETLRLVAPPKEAKVCKMEMSTMVAGSCALAKTTDGAKEEPDPGGRSLLQLPLLAVKSVSTVMVSALQSGWQMCSWKSSVSSTSVSSQMKTGSPLQSPEAEMLREVYLVLWAIRKQLRQLARRQERRRQRHVAAQAGPQPDPVQGMKRDAQSPL